jgi:putative Mn2+ efflux pump MntP
MSFTDLISVLLIALSLSADCFAVALVGSISLRKLRYIQVLRTALVFGIFQTVMAILGWLVGRTVIDFIASFDHWVIFGLLAVVGGRMIWEAFHEDEERVEGTDISKGLLLITLAIATSIDSLAVGLSFGLLDTKIISASLIIGIVTFIITNLGFYVGQGAGGLLGQRAKIVGGLILIGIGVKEVLVHFLG